MLIEVFIFFTSLGQAACFRVQIPMPAEANIFNRAAAAVLLFIPLKMNILWAWAFAAPRGVLFCRLENL